MADAPVTAQGPEDPQAADDQGQAPDAGPGGVTKLVQMVGQGLQQLAQVLEGSGASTPQDKAQMNQILSLFVDLVEKKLGGSAPGEDQPSGDATEAEGQGQVPMQQGQGGVPMGPQTRQ